MRKRLSPVKTLFGASVGVLSVAYAQCYYEVTKLCHNDDAIIGSILVTGCDPVDVNADGPCYGSDTTVFPVQGQQGRATKNAKACDCLGIYKDCNDQQFYNIFNFPSEYVSEEYPNPTGYPCS